MTAPITTSIEEHELLPLTPQEYEQFRKLAYEKFGLDLRSGKEQLVSARLAKKMRELRIRSYRDYYRHIVEDQSGEALVALIDALTTNHTCFFREPAHFDFLRSTVIPRLRQRDRISIWSAASSTGEEPYSIAFCLLSELGMEAVSRIEITGTDISTRVLATAKAGAYPAERFREFSPQQMRQFLLRGEGRWENWYLVKKPIRDCVHFRRINLMDAFPGTETYPVIFCRNVMIYFDRQTQQDLVRRLTERLEPGGYLLIGHAESLNGIDTPLEYVRPATYQKPAGCR